MRHWAKHILPAGAAALPGTALLRTTLLGPTVLGAALLGATLLVAASCDVSAHSPATRAGAPADTGTPAVSGVTSEKPATEAVDTGAREGGAIAAGTNLALASAVQLCTGISRAGDAFTATVTGAVMGSRGAVIPVGSIVVGHVVDSRDSLALAFDSVAIAGAARMVSYPLAARMIGPPQTVSMPPPPHPSPGMNYTKIRTYCIPDHGRITIQLTGDVPVDR